METEKYKKLLEKVGGYYRDAMTGNEDTHKRGLEVMRFVLGSEGQWRESDLKALTSDQRPAVTINYTRRYVEYMLGVFQSNRKDIVIFPRISKKKYTSDSLTDEIKHIYDRNDAIYEEDKQFFDGIAPERGWMHIWTEEDVVAGNRKIRMGRVCNFDVFSDPFCTKYDFDATEGGGKHITLCNWVDKEYLEAMYPNRVDEIKKAGSKQPEYDAGTSPDEIAATMMQYKKYDDPTSPFHLDDAVRREEYRYCVRYTYYKEYKKGVEVYDRKAMRCKKVTDPDIIKEAEINEGIFPDRFSVSEPKTLEFLRMVKWMPGILLEYNEDPWDCDNQITLFPLVPYSANFHDGVCQGVLEDVIGQGDVIGPQCLANKVLSQGLDHLNRSVNSPVYFTKDTFVSQNEAKRFKDHGTKPGQKYELKSMDHKPAIGEPAQFNSSYMNLFSLAIETLKETTVNDPSIGFKTSDDLSGIAIEKLQNQAIMTKSIAFTNHEHTKRMIARLLVEVLTKCEIYSVDELDAILGPDIFENPDLIELAQEQIGMPPEDPQMAIQGDLQQAMEIDPERAQMDAQAVMSTPQMQMAMQRYQQQMRMYEKQLRQVQLQIIYDSQRSARTVEYNVKISEGQHTLTRQYHNMLAIRTFNEIYPQAVPPEVAVKLIDLPYKEEIITYIQSQRGMAQNVT